MSDLSRIVQVNITRQTQAVSQKGFGIGLILGADDAEKPGAMTTRTRTYLSLSGVLEDFAATTEVYKAAQAYFGQQIKPESVVVGFVEGAETVAEAMAAIKDENGDWYAVGTTSTVQADQEALAAYIETDCRIAAVRTDNASSIDVTETGIGGVLASQNRDRTFVKYVSDTNTYAEFAWLGEVLPKLPGSVNWMFKTLSGVVADNLTDTQRLNLQNKNINYYNTFGGQDITEQGTMASGAFIDEIRGVDFIQARMQEAIYARLVNLDKIPYTNQGVDIIVAEMEAVLQRAVIINNILAADPAPVVNKPNVRDIPFNDRAARCLPDITFSAVLAGAVNKIKIAGNVTV